MKETFNEESIFRKLLHFLKNNFIILIFLSFVIAIAILGLIYQRELHPQNNDVLKVIDKYTVNDYTIPYHVAERYLTWFNMRTFFFALDYALILLGIVASLMTVFYASKGTPSTRIVANESNVNIVANETTTTSYTEKNDKNTMVFLSLLALTFTIANIYIDAGSKANMAQHAWRELDMCIMETIHNTELSENEKSIIIVQKVTEMEKYIALFEN